MGGSPSVALGSERTGALASGRAESSSSGFVEDRFLTRARGLFYARIAFLVLGLGVIGVPGWSQSFGVGGRAAFAVYVAMVGYTALNYWLIGSPRLGRAVTFVTLCCDLCVLVWLLSVTARLRGPALAPPLLFHTLLLPAVPPPLRGGAAHPPLPFLRHAG